MKKVSYRVYSLALSKLQAALGDDRRISVYDMGGSCGQPVQLGVNWSAIGTVPASEAVDFARRLTAAAEAAAGFEFNGYHLTFGEED